MELRERTPLVMDEADPTLRTEVLEGEGVVETLAPRALALGRRALLVTDPGLVAAGHVERVEALLRDGGLEVTRFADVRENPTSEDVDRCAAAAREVRPELLIGLGGGSAIDVAKGANFVHCCGGTMADYRGRGKATAPLLPLIAIPTTAGTGTEVQSFSLIVDPETHQKMACGDPQAAPRLAVLDAALTLTMPRFVTACTGLDAIGHAVEVAVTRAGNERSSRLAHDAFVLAAKAFPRVLARPDDVEARAAMLRAACLAGRAIENSMLGAAHSMANPLTARYDLPHGQAVATALPVVVRFNARHPGPAAAYAELARDAGLAERADTDAEAAETLARTLGSFLEAAGMPATLAERGATAADVPALAAEAAGQWTAGFNPREVDAAAFATLFEALLGDQERS